MSARRWWWIDAILPAAIDVLPGDVAIECDADGQTYCGRGIVGEAHTPDSGQTTLLIRGSDELSTEP